MFKVNDKIECLNENTIIYIIDKLVLTFSKVKSCASLNIVFNSQAGNIENINIHSNVFIYIENHKTIEYEDDIIAILVFNVVTMQLVLLDTNQITNKLKWVYFHCYVSVSHVHRNI